MNVQIPLAEKWRLQADENSKEIEPYRVLYSFALKRTPKIIGESIHPLMVLNADTNPNRVKRRTRFVHVTNVFVKKPEMTVIDFPRGHMVLIPPDARPEIYVMYETEKESDSYWWRLLIATYSSEFQFDKSIPIHLREFGGTQLMTNSYYIGAKQLKLLPQLHPVEVNVYKNDTKKMLSAYCHENNSAVLQIVRANYYGDVFIDYRQALDVDTFNLMFCLAERVVYESIAENMFVLNLNLLNKFFICNTTCKMIEVQTVTKEEFLVYLRAIPKINYLPTLVNDELCEVIPHYVYEYKYMLLVADLRLNIITANKKSIDQVILTKSIIERDEFNGQPETNVTFPISLASNIYINGIKFWVIAKDKNLEVYPPHILPIVINILDIDCGTQLPYDKNGTIIDFPRREAALEREWQP